MRLFTKSEVDLLLRAQAIGKAKGTIELLSTIAVAIMTGESANQLIAFAGKELIAVYDKAREELLPHKVELAALVEEFKEGQNAPEEVPN